jgi:hypothetical protein
MKVTPHVAQNKSNRQSAVADEIAASEGYGISMQKRKLIEQGFGWAKSIGLRWGVLVPESASIIEKRALASAAKLRPLGISAAC